MTYIARHVAGFSDADWARSPTNRSTIGYCVFVGENIVLKKIRNKMWFQDLVLSLSI